MRFQKNRTPPSKLRAKRAKKIGFFTVYKGGNGKKVTKKRPPKAAENFDKNRTPRTRFGGDFKKIEPREKEFLESELKGV